MRKIMTASLSVTALLFAFGVAQAGQVTVKGVHLCCGQCVKIIGDDLGKVDGVSDIASDRETKTVTFTAADEKAAKAGIVALAKSGFHGEAKHGDEKLKFPDSGAKKGDKADKVVLTSVHLCCGACVNAVKKAVADSDIKAEVETDRDTMTVTLTGSDIDVTAAVAVLNKAGFHAKVKK